jgi:hypothetical protein
VTLHGTRFALVARHRDHEARRRGAAADLAGTTFVLPDLTVKRQPTGRTAPGGAGPATSSILRLLDNPPFRVLEPVVARARDASAARGRGDHRRARVGFPLKQALRPEEVSYIITGALEGVAAEDLLPGRRLGAERLALRVTPAAVELTGPVSVDGMPLDATYRLPMEPGSAGAAEVSARLRLTPETLSTLGVSLPPAR